MIFVIAFTIAPQFSYATTSTVAKVYLLANPGQFFDEEWGYDSVNGCGHAFLAVLNTSKSTIKVGKYKLSSGAFLTVGTYGNIPDGKRGYYNVEKYRMLYTSEKYKPNVYLSKRVTLKQLKRLSGRINGTCSWTESRNCAYFARRCWNTMVGEKSKLRIKPATGIETPTSMYRKIKKKDSHKANFALSKKRSCTLKHVYIQKAEGLRHLSEKAQKVVKNPE